MNYKIINVRDARIVDLYEAAKRANVSYPTLLKRLWTKEYKAGRGFEKTKKLTLNEVERIALHNAYFKQQQENASGN